ncbi:MAG: adenylate/guanylate cyclase domain-containing protein [Alphaproteobacteria bacterium]
MIADTGTNVQLEIGHVLFMDMVGYSQLLLDEQRELQEQLTQIVRNSEQVRAAEAADKLIRVPTGDGMALVFFNSPEAPVRCAIEIGQAIKGSTKMRLRMGIHSGPVNEVRDVNDQTNVAGAGVNIAQRVMDCGDDGHILVSRRVAEDLAQARFWRPYLHDLGEFETKHGVGIFVVNLYTDEVGNPELPEKLKRAQEVLSKSASPTRSIAVLPFDDVSPTQDRDYFGDGIAEEILTALSKVDGLRVAARRSSFWFKDKNVGLSEVAEKLNVCHVVEGSVRRDGNRVRVTAELIDACDGFTMWSETFERELRGIFSVQDEITRSIVDALKLKLDVSPRPRVRSANAYDAYLQGLFYSDKGTEEALRKSLEFFQRALDKDPKFGRAWTGIAKAWLWLADVYVPPLTAYSNVREAAIKALNIDREDAEAHVYLAESKRILEWNLGEAEAEYRRAFEIDPNSTSSNYFIAAFYAARGDRDEALAYLQRTSKIDPASLWVNNSACELYRYFGLYDEAIAAGERALQLDPAFVYGEPLLAALYREMGRFDDAITLYRKAQDVSGRPTFGMAITHARMNQRDQALQMLHEATDFRGYTAGDVIAHVYVALGEYDATIKELERARDERSSSLHTVGIAPEFVPLRSDERFLSLLREIGLEPEKVFAASQGPNL